MHREGGIMTMELTMNETDRLQVVAMLAGVRNGAPKVLSRAVNKTLDGVKTDADKEIRSIITMKKTDVMKTFTTRKATVSNLSARVICSDKPESLIKFSNTQRKKGISVKVLKSSSRTVLKHAFYVTTLDKEGNENKWIAERKNKDKGQSARKNVVYSALPKRYRLPIEKLTGPRVADIMGKPAVMKKIQNQADERLHKNINQQLNYELSKL
jgi:hypothetical protein